MLNSSSSFAFNSNMVFKSFSAKIISSTYNIIIKWSPRDLIKRDWSNLHCTKPRVVTKLDNLVNHCLDICFKPYKDLLWIVNGPHRVGCKTLHGHLYHPSLDPQQEWRPTSGDRGHLLFSFYLYFLFFGFFLIYLFLI